MCAAALALSIGGASADAAERADPTSTKHVAGGTLALPASLAGGKPNGIATDAASGNVYLGVTRGDDAYVAVFDNKGAFVRQWLVDKRPLTLRLDDFRLAVGPDGNVYVAPQLLSTTQDELIKVYKPDGSPVRTFGEGSHLFTVTDIEVDAAGNVFVTSRARPGEGVPDDVIVKFNPQGQVVARFTPFPGDRGQTGNDLSALALAPDGSIWVATRKLNKPIIHLDSAGKTLAAPDFVFALPGTNDTVDDVDFAGGKLYASGYLGEQKGRLALVVLTPEGVVQDSIAGRAHYVAVGPRVILAGYERASRLASHGGSVSQYVPVPVATGPITGSFGHCGGPLEHQFEGTLARSGNSQLRVPARQANDCYGGFAQSGSPWPNDDCHPVGSYLGGEPLSTPVSESFGFFHVSINRGEMRSGTVILEWLCDPGDGSSPELRYENKGEVVLYDPSGVVLRGKKRLAGATVRLEFSPTRRGKFGTPALSLMDPQMNPQVTHVDGAFGWDVAAGFWRLRVSAYGYKRFVSQVYSIPPEVTGLQLRLKRDARQQARLLEPLAGRAGPVTLGAKRKRARGLRVKLASGKVRRIDVRSKSYRTALGTHLGSTAPAFRREFGGYVIPADLKAGKALSRYKIGKATFTLKKDRVASIVLGR